MEAMRAVLSDGMIVRVSSLSSHHTDGVMMMAGKVFPILNGMTQIGQNENA
jgi:hypothetical protein